MKDIKTPLRYPGGKSRAAAKLLGLFPSLMFGYDEYREAFLGGGSMAIAVTKQHPNIKIWVNDLYWPLYNFWVQLRDRGDELHFALWEQKCESDTPERAKKLFKWCRDKMNDPNFDDFSKAVCFWIINKCSFSGLTESSSFSESASEKCFSLNNIHKLKEYPSIIKNWKITNQSYETLLDGTPKSFVYLDPPYEISSNLYGKKGGMHKHFDHDQFADNCNESYHDHHMAISYNADKSVKDRFPDWQQIEFDLTYTMRTTGAYMEEQKKRKELLLVNYLD
jgi:DNA adenine methylase